MIPDIDRERLAVDARAWLERTGLSTRTASAQFPGLNPAMISRACGRQQLSAASMIVLCTVMGKDPGNYLVFLDRRQGNQSVTAFGKRETSGVTP